MADKRRNVQEKKQDYYTLFVRAIFSFYNKNNIIFQGNYNIKNVEIINSFGGNNSSLFDVFKKTLNSV
jgi:hypothetical protein